jgi:TP901 family phage tail tape measure protein
MASRLIQAIVIADTAQASAKFDALAAQSAEVAGSSTAEMDAAGASTASTTSLFSIAGIKAAAMANPYAAAAIAVGAAALGVGVFAVKMADGFDKASNSLAANAGISQKAAKGISDSFLDASNSTIYDATAITSAYASVAGQLGAVQGHALDAAQAQRVMNAAQNLATASGMSLGGATKDLANVMMLYGLNTKQAAAASDTLYEAGVISGQGVDGVTSAVQKMHAQLGAATPPLGQVAGLLDDLAQHGETGRQGLSAVSTGMTTLIKNSEPVVGKMTSAQAALRAVGVSAFGAQGQLLPFGNIIGQLAPKLDAMTLSNGKANTAAQMQALGAVFGTTANKKLLDVILAGPDAYNKDVAAVTASGLAHAAAQKQLQNLGAMFDEVKTKVIDTAIQFGEKLTPALGTVGNAIVKVAGMLTNDLQPVFAVISAGVATLSAWISDHWNTIKDVTSNVWNAIHEILSLWWSAISTEVTIAWDTISTIIGTAITVIITVVETIDKIITFLVGVWQTVTSDITGFIGDVVGLFNGLPGPIKTAVEVITNILIAPFQLALAPIEAVVNQITSWIGDIIGSANQASSQLTNVQNNAVTSQVGTGKGVGVLGHAATGGIFNSPAIVSLAENGPEMVIPLTGPQPGAPLPSSLGGGGVTIDARIMNPVFQGTPQTMLAQMQALIERGNQQLITTLNAL